MKLAAIYNVWDGEELLQGSIDRIRPYVDEIIIVWQDKSNYGESYTPRLPTVKGHYLQYEPNLSLNGFNNEKIKRQAGLDVAKRLNCTHFILMDCDEYYKPEDFKNAKEYLAQNNFDGAVVKLITYYKHKTWRLENMEGYYVPFIHRLMENTVCGYNQYPYYCDPTRSINAQNVIELPVSMCVMHHYSWIRENIERKLNNSSAKVNFSDKISKFIEEFRTAKIGDVVSYYGQKLVETEAI